MIQTHFTSALRSHSLRLVEFGQIDPENYMVLHRHFVNLLMCYLLHYFASSPDILRAVKQLFRNRVNPFLEGRLRIRPWIDRVAEKEREIEASALAYNRKHKGFLLLVKFMFVWLMDPRAKTVLVGRIWCLLEKFYGIKMKARNILLFLKVVERHHDPIECAANYLEKFGSFKHPQFARRARSVFAMAVRVEEFFRVLALFVFEKIAMSSKKRVKNDKSVFCSFIRKIKVQ